MATFTIGNPAAQAQNFTALHRYLSLAQGPKVQAEYIWIGGSGSDLRSKAKTLSKKVTNLSDLPLWNYDGSSTGQASGHYSEIWLKPVKYVPDPFRGGNNILVLCETLNAKKMTPIPTNKRAAAAKIFEHKSVIEEETWYGIEQEYTMLTTSGHPLGWPANGFPAPQGPYYCSIGSNVAYGRHIVEAHYKACLYAGLDIAGINAEVMPGQWEYQCGPCVGIDSGDQLWLSRYILERIAEDFGVVISYDPKPIKGDWNGTGCHTNYSTKSMRADGGYKHIISAIKKLGKNHKKHMAVYGKDNQSRLTGHHETAKYDEFKYGVANRGASIRIPRQTEIDQKGYFEDRRPAANMDPYDVTSIIAQTTIIDNGNDDDDDDDDDVLSNIGGAVDANVKNDLINKVKTIQQLSNQVIQTINNLSTK